MIINSLSTKLQRVRSIGLPQAAVVQISASCSPILSSESSTTKLASTTSTLSAIRESATPRLRHSASARRSASSPPRRQRRHLRLLGWSGGENHDAELSILVSRATQMRALLCHVRPHLGGWRFLQPVHPGCRTACAPQRRPGQISNFPRALRPSALGAPDYSLYAEYQVVYSRLRAQQAEAGTWSQRLR
jgi:hypothetical protein